MKSPRREAPAEEDAGQVEERDGVALGHEREHGHVTEHRGRRGGGHGHGVSCWQSGEPRVPLVSWLVPLVPESFAVLVDCGDCWS